MAEFVLFSGGVQKLSNDKIQIYLLFPVALSLTLDWSLTHNDSETCRVCLSSWLFCKNAVFEVHNLLYELYNQNDDDMNAAQHSAVG